MSTAWKVFTFRVDVVCILPHSEWIRGLALYISILSIQNDLIALVKNIKFRKHNPFQTKLNKDLKSLHISNKTVTFTDKTTNLYHLTKEEHNKLLQNTITSKYKVPKKIKDKVNKDDKRILNERLHTDSDSNCFITMKEHKEIFENKPSIRLINPAKN